MIWTRILNHSPWPERPNRNRKGGWNLNTCYITSRILTQPSGLLHGIPWTLYPSYYLVPGVYDTSSWVPKWTWLCVEGDRRGPMTDSCHPSISLRDRTLCPLRRLPLKPDSWQTTRTVWKESNGTTGLVNVGGKRKEKFLRHYWIYHQTVERLRKDWRKSKMVSVKDFILWIQKIRQNHRRRTYRTYLGRNHNLFTQIYTQEVIWPIHVSDTDVNELWDTRHQISEYYTLIITNTWCVPKFLIYVSMYFMFRSIIVVTCTILF